MLAKRNHRWQNASMTVQITIRGVPQRTRDQLAQRAAAEGRSMEEFLRLELERLAARPTVGAWLEDIRKRKRASGSRVSAASILAHRRADRR